MRRAAILLASAALLASARAASAKPTSLGVEAPEVQESDGPFYLPTAQDQAGKPKPPPLPPAPPAPTRFSGWFEAHKFVSGRISGTTSGAALRYAGDGPGVFAGVLFDNRLYFLGMDGGRNFATRVSSLGSGALYALYPHFEMRVMSALTEKHWVFGAGTSVTGLRWASGCGAKPAFTAEIRGPMLNLWMTTHAAGDGLTSPAFGLTVGALLEVGVF